MVYGLQHNGKGKYHLIPQEGEGSELCGYTGGLFSSEDEAEYIDGQWYTRHYITGLTKIPDWEIPVSYCKKCLKSAAKKATL